MSQPSTDITQQNEVLNQMNTRLTELAESESSVIVFCAYNDNRMGGFGEVRLPLRFYQAHQHLLLKVPGSLLLELSSGLRQHHICNFEHLKALLQSDQHRVYQICLLP